MFVCGIDENGLGPRLGPLVVTGVLVETAGPNYAAPDLWRLSAPDHPVRDSKALFKPDQMARAEAATLPWIRAAVGDAASEIRLHEKMVLNHPVFSTRDCPACAEALCAARDLALPRWMSQDESQDLGACKEKISSILLSSRARIALMKSMVLCPARFNREVVRLGKLFLDFKLFMDLAVEVRKHAGRDLLFLCGKIGSTQKYGAWFEALGLKAEARLETRPESAYLVEGLGEVRFIRDADASHFPVALASMAGKYLRELAMDRLNAALRSWQLDIRSWVSGYPGERTNEAIRVSIAARDRLGLPLECFVRIR